MATYLGRTIITMPSAPAPKSVEFSQQNKVAAPESPFTGQQQVQDWMSDWLEASVQLPAMTQAQAADWVTFLRACKGQACVFQLSNEKFASLVPAGAVPAGYWCMKTNAQKWSITEGIIFGLQFEIREAI
jgi:hypothetical protein